MHKPCLSRLYVRMVAQRLKSSIELTRCWHDMPDPTLILLIRHEHCFKVPYSAGEHKSVVTNRCEPMRLNSLEQCATSALENTSMYPLTYPTYPVLLTRSRRLASPAFILGLMYTSGSPIFSWDLQPRTILTHLVETVRKRMDRTSPEAMPTTKMRFGVVAWS